MILKGLYLIYDMFIGSINSTCVYYNKFADLAISEDIKTERDLSELSNYYEFSVEKEGNINEVEIGIKPLKEIIDIKPKDMGLPMNYQVLSNGTFIMFNNYFESLIKNILTFYYVKNIKSLNNKEFKVSLKEINEHDTIEELNKFLVYREVEKMLFEKSFDELLKHFESELKINLERDIIDWDFINEMRERRHIIVHNSSKINKKYIVKSKNPYNYEIGDVVTIDKEYFEKCYHECLLSAAIMVYNCMKKWDKDNLHLFAAIISKHSYNFLKVGKFYYVEKLFNFCKKSEGKSKIEDQALFFNVKINYCISLKKKGNDNELKKALSALSIGNKSIEYKIAHKILSDNHIDLVKYMKKAITIGEIKKENYFDWPLFDFIKADIGLNEEILNLFAEMENG